MAALLSCGRRACATSHGSSHYDGQVGFILQRLPGLRDRDVVLVHLLDHEVFH
jgi:hypothetical protein